MTSDRFSGSARGRRRGVMRRHRMAFVAAAVALAVFAAHSIVQRVAARAALAEGEEAFRRGDFVRAAERFDSALEIDPGSVPVRLRLVAAYQRQYVPGGESRANHDVAKRALEEITRVLDRDPSNQAAILAAGEINDGRSDYEQARRWYGRLAAIDSSSAAAFAGMSAASLTQVSGAVLDAESRAGLLPAAFALRASAPRANGLRASAARANALHASAPRANGEPIANDDLRRSLAARWSAAIAEGIDAASKAVAIDREHAGAMLTLAAWSQLAADLAASPDEYRRHMIAAEEWRLKALDARRLKVLKAERGSS
jgi:tetratricopeptide (TPR) repeat protein